MENKTIKQKTTSNLNDLYEDFYFKLNKNNNLYLDTHEETDDGTFETIKDWNELMKNLNNDEIQTLLDFYFGSRKEYPNNKECCFDGFKLHLVDEKEKSPNFEPLKLIFNEPQKFVFGEIGFGDKKEYVTKDITELYCSIIFEPYWFADKSKKLQTEFCNGIEIYLTDIVFIK